MKLKQEFFLILEIPMDASMSPINSKAIAEGDYL